MSYATVPKLAHLVDCRCGGKPQVLRITIDGVDKWAFVCPECAKSMIGARVEGFVLSSRDLVEVTKPGDMFDNLVELWNGHATAGEGMAR